MSSYFDTHDVRSETDQLWEPEPTLFEKTCKGSKMRWCEDHSVVGIAVDITPDKYIVLDTGEKRIAIPEEQLEWVD